MRVRVAYVAPGVELLVTLELVAGATVADAVRAPAIAERIGAVPGEAAYAIFGRRVRGDTPLADGDRVDITRPLRCDPKAVRHERAARRAAATQPRTAAKRRGT